MKRYTRRVKARHKGGGVASSKQAKPAALAPAPVPVPLPAPPPSKRVVVFDIDDTLLCRREIWGQLNLHEMRVRAGLASKNDDCRATINDIVPRPDFFFPESSMFVYLRPNVKEALAYAKEYADAVYAFSASSDPASILRQTGLADYFDGVFGREFTTPARADSMYILRKNLAALRTHLHLTERDELYMLDDRPEWIDAGLSGASDHIVAVPPFQPSYKLYGVQVIKNPHQDDPSDTIPNDTALMNSLLKIV